MRDTYKNQLQRLHSFADVANLSLLSPSQIEAFHETFVKGTKKLDRAMVVNSPESRYQVVETVNGIMVQMGNLNTGSPSYKQRKAAYEGMLKNFAPDGIVLYPDHPELIGQA